jgi:hypothetical protein
MARRDQHVFLICPHCFRSTTAVATDVERELDRLIHSLWRVPIPGSLAAVVAARQRAGEPSARQRTTRSASGGTKNSRRNSRLTH